MLDGRRSNRGRQAEAGDEGRDKAIALDAFGKRECQDRERQRQVLEDLCDTMVDGSLCAMGGLTPYPVRSALMHFPEDFG